MNLEKYRICLNHFVSGKPADLTDSTNTDWLPTINLGHTKILPPTKAQSERYERVQRRNEDQAMKERVFHNTAEAISVEAVHLTVQEEVVEILKETMEEVKLVEIMDRYITEFIESSLAVFIKANGS